MPAKAIWGRDSPIWSRFYSMPAGQELDATAEKELEKVRVASAVVFNPHGSFSCSLAVHSGGDQVPEFVRESKLLARIVCT